MTDGVPPGPEKTTALFWESAEDYTDVIILGFTYPNIIENKADEFQQK